ncbi:MAG TPA: hypothetical protein PK809_09180 [Bacteroidia bacterium]|nr:hypothetical protein [Bacteroidia bacterium]
MHIKNFVFLQEMFKKISTLFLMTIAISIIMAHNIVPHSHHTADAHQQHQNSGPNENPLSDMFAHFQHFTFSNQTEFTTSLKTTSNTKDLFPLVFLVIEVNQIWLALQTALPKLPIEYLCKRYSIERLSALLFRGPPAFQ